MTSSHKLNFILAIMVFGYFTALSSSPSMAAETRYIDDKVYVPMRSGPSNKNRIIHKGLPSGTTLVVIETSGSFSKVVTNDGLEGWVSTQYLSNDKTAAMKLEKLQKLHDKLKDELPRLKESLQSKVKEASALQKELNQSKSELEKLNEELNRIKALSSSTIELDENYKQLIQQHELKKSELEQLNVDNIRLQDRIESNRFYETGMAICFGILLAWILPKLFKKRDNGWR